MKFWMHIRSLWLANMGNIIMDVKTKGNLDRISQGYNGDLGYISQEKAKKRINWICEQVNGQDVLDVGCSQGIVSILLGIGNKRVTGIDIAEESIKYADNLKKEEDKRVISNVNFIQGDFLQYEFNKKFDTVIMGEILEHVFNPEEFIDKAIELLNNNGRIIITVPFGINPFPDHKRTYYFLELFNQINKRIKVAEVCFLGGWIGFVADNNSKEDNVIIDDKLLKKLENNFFYIDSEKQKQIEAHKSKIERLNKELAALKNMNGINKITNIESVNNERLSQKLEEIDMFLKESLSNKDVNEEIINLIEELYKARSDVKLLQIENNFKEKEYEKELKEVNSKLLKEIEKNREIINETENEKENLRKEIAIIIADKEKAEQELEGNEKKLIELQNVIENIKAENEEKLCECTDKNDEINQLKIELKEALDVNEKILQKKAYDNIEIEKLTEQVTLYSNQVCQLTEENTFKDGEIKELNNKIIDYDPIIEELSEQIEFYKTKLEKTNKIRNRLAKEKELYNTLLYKAKRKNAAYEKLFEVRLYNYVKSKINKNPVDDSMTIEGNICSANTMRLREKEAYIDELIKLAEEIPDSNGSRYFKRNSVRMGIIADEFQLETYGDVAEVIYFSPKNYKADIDVLFIVSTWHGINDDWTGLGRPKETGGVKDNLFDIIEYHRNKGAKIVFYSKEDPGNYNVFLYIAKECDYIFTSDVDCVHKYIEDTGNPNVFVLPFAINPLIHNPIGFEKYMRDEVIFAGTWGYANKYPERNVDMSILLDGVIASDKELKIFDRNFYHDNDAYKYPVRYDDYVYPSIDHTILMKVHKLFKWAININSSKYSKSMFSSRVYELQACGSLIISNFNIGMKNMFPNVFIEFFPYLIKETFDRLSPYKEYELQLEGIRKMYGSATVYHRFNYILEKIGLSNLKQNLDKSVLVIVDDKNKNNVDNFERQSYANKKVLRLKEVTEDILNSVDMVTYFNKDHHYGEFYLEDMINCFKYTDSDFVTKSSYFNGDVFVEGEKSNYYDGIPDIYRTVFWRENYDITSIINKSLQNNNKNSGYAADTMNYNALSEFIKEDR